MTKKVLQTKKTAFEVIWLLIFFELILLLSLLFVSEILIWWGMIWFGRTFAECSLLDTSLFRPPGVLCTSNVFYANQLEKIMQTYSDITTPFTTTVLFLLFGAGPLVIFSLAVVSLLFASLYFVFLKKTSNSDQKLKFPLLSRFLLTSLYNLKKHYAKHA